MEKNLLEMSRFVSSGDGWRRPESDSRCASAEQGGWGVKEKDMREKAEESPTQEVVLSAE